MLRERNCAKLFLSPVQIRLEGQFRDEVLPVVCFRMLPMLEIQLLQEYFKVERAVQPITDCLPYTNVV